jgi:hypothetical protein
VKALARAHRWKRLLESGRYGSLAEQAAAGRIDRSYLGEMLRLTLLAPDIVEAVLDGRQPAEIDLPALLDPMPGSWDEQRILIAGVGCKLPAQGAESTGPAHHSSGFAIIK